MKNTLKTLFLLALICSSFLQVNAQEVIHKDPYDIKTTNISIMPFIHAPQLFGFHLGAFHYFNSKMMVGYELSYVPSSFSLLSFDYEFGDYNNLKPQKSFLLNQFQFDYHLIDIEKQKKIKVHISSSGNSRVSIQRYTEVNSSVRRVLAINGGLWFQTGSEKMTPTSRSFNGPIEIKNKSNNQTIDLNGDPSTQVPTIVTHTSYTNFEIGIKYKNITATGINTEDGKRRWNQKQFDFYLGMLLPISSKYDANIGLQDSTTTATHELIGGKPTIGFKAGIYGRSIMKTGLSFKTEFGAMPTIAFTGTRYFFSIGLGMSLNFGKVSMLKG